MEMLGIPVLALCESLTIVSAAWRVGIDGNRALESHGLPVQCKLICRGERGAVGRYEDVVNMIESSWHRSDFRYGIANDFQYEVANSTIRSRFDSVLIAPSWFDLEAA